jgi:hypothetical protein
MPDKTIKGLRLLCIALLALLVGQLVKVGFHANPLAHVTIPAIPTLATNSPATNRVAGGLAKPPTSATKTNSVAATNAVAASNTNAPTPAASSTNLVASTNAAASATNPVAPTDVSNTVAQITPPALPSPSETNQVASTNSATTNIVAASASGTNTVATNQVAAPGTNQTRAEGVASGTNASAPRPSAKAKKSSGGGMPSGPGGGPGGPGRAKALPAATQAWVDKIVDSEIFAPVMRPQPMALMGIAGDVAFLRSPSGQTGLVKVGDSLGEIKLVKIGINRVLVEQDGQPKELTVFNGYGSDTLLPSQPSTAP